VVEELAKVKLVEGFESFGEARSVSCCLARGETVGEGGKGWHVIWRFLTYLF